MAMFKQSARLRSAADLTPLLDVWSVQLAWSDKARFQIELALEELVVNTFNHGQSAGSTAQAEPICIDVAAQQDGADLTIELKDNATAFDPTQFTPPDVTLSAEDRKIGGLGLFFASKMMDSIQYTRDGSVNHLLLRKRLV